MRLAGCPDYGSWLFLLEISQSPLASPLGVGCKHPEPPNSEQSEPSLSPACRSICPPNASHALIASFLHHIGGPVRLRSGRQTTYLAQPSHQRKSDRVVIGHVLVLAAPHAPYSSPSSSVRALCLGRFDDTRPGPIPSQSRPTWRSLDLKCERSDRRRGFGQTCGTRPFGRTFFISEISHQRFPHTPGRHLRKAPDLHHRGVVDADVRPDTNYVEG